MVSHGVITRLHYHPEDPKLQWRIAFYRTMVLPRLLNQTDQNFEIWVICHPNCVDLTKSIHERLNVFPVDNYPSPEEKQAPFKPADFPKFDIQTAFDSDDLVTPNYIAKIKEEVAKQPDKTLIVSFQPYKLNLLTLKRYKMWERYDHNLSSMFFSLYQPDKSEYRHILEFDHTFISHWCNNIVTVPEGYCDMTIHGGNWMTGLEPNLGEV